MRRERERRKGTRKGKQREREANIKLVAGPALLQKVWDISLCAIVNRANMTVEVPWMRMMNEDPSFLRKRTPKTRQKDLCSDWFSWVSAWNVLWKNSLVLFSSLLLFACLVYFDVHIRSVPLFFFFVYMPLLHQLIFTKGISGDEMKRVKEAGSYICTNCWL